MQIQMNIPPHLAHTSIGNLGNLRVDLDLGEISLAGPHRSSASPRPHGSHRILTGMGAGASAVAGMSMDAHASIAQHCGPDLLLELEALKTELEELRIENERCSEGEGTWCGQASVGYPSAGSPGVEPAPGPAGAQEDLFLFLFLFKPLPNVTTYQ